MDSRPSQTAIVTGAGKRVGRALAEGLAARGWRVVGQVRSADDSVSDGVLKVVADLDRANAAETLFDAAEGGPPVELLVNNAARFSWDGPGEFDAGEFDRHMATNARAPAFLIEEMARRHRLGCDACVINILDSKIAAPNPDFLSYTLSKQALQALTDLYARALADKGIRVNAVAPALMLRSPGQSEENFRAMHAANPLRHGVVPADVLDAIVYLADARGVTGQTIVIDGGQRFLALGRDVQFLDHEESGE